MASDIADYQASPTAVAARVLPTDFQEPSSRIGVTQGHECEALLRAKNHPLSMAIKKYEQYSSLWEGCDELRGIDASESKDRLPVLLFIKYVSDNHANPRHAMIDASIGRGFAYTPAGVSR